MPLASGKSGLKSDLLAIYNNIGLDGQTAADQARKKAAAIHKYVLTGKPMTIITTFPGPVVGAQTAGPVTGKGMGGLDKPVPGMGLSAAKSILEAQLTAMYYSYSTSADQKADEEASAIHAYFSQAIVMTNDKTDGPVPCPPVAGPAAGSIKGKGGVLSDAPGKGYDAAESELASALEAIMGSVGSQNESAADKAKKTAAAIHAFCIEGKVDTQGTFVAPAAVAPPPAPPMGAYFPGIGASTSGKIS